MFAPRDDLSRSVSDGSQPSTMVSGTSAREEGLRTLTSPRREASLFKLGRSLLVPAISFAHTASEGLTWDLFDCDSTAKEGFLCWRPGLGKCAPGRPG